MVLFGSQKRLGMVEREILESITAGDTLVGFLCSARSSRRMYKIAHERARARYRTLKAIDGLAAKGLVVLKDGTLSITESGKNALDYAINKTLKSIHVKHWDGKWRIVAYDIPAAHNKLRDELRYILKRAGFRKLHQSVWVFPHECKELTELIRYDRRLKSCVLYGVLESIEGEDMLRAHFGI